MSEAPKLELDRELLVPFKRGDRDALSRVYRMYVGDVVRALRHGTIVRIDGRLTRVGAGLSEGDLEVLVQNTFIRAFSPSARAAYDGLRPYEPYLITIARNLLIDDARKRNRSQKVEAIEKDVEGVADMDPQTDPEVRLAARQLADALSEVKRGLSALEQDLFRLRYDEGLSQKEAARKLGVSLITVRRKDVQLRERLLEGLRKAGHLSDIAVGIPSSERDRTRG